MYIRNKRFNDVQKEKLGASLGAYSEVTVTEAGDGQITLDTCEKEVLFSVMSEDDILKGGKNIDPAKALKSFRIYPENNLIALSLVYPKPHKKELRLYPSLENGFKPDPREIWFIFVREGQIHMGHMPKQQWESLSEQTNDEKDFKNALQDYIEAPDDNLNKTQKIAAVIRKGQPKFRKNLLDAYDHKCSISDHGPDSVLEAAHIIPHAKSGINKLSNGILLRAELHSLFDDNLLGIDPESHTVEINPILDGTPYHSIKGKILRPQIDGNYPCTNYLSERWKEFQLTVQSL